MKKVFLLLIILCGCFSLCACKEKIEYVEVEKPIYIEVEKPIQVEIIKKVEVPVEVIKEVEKPVYIEIEKPVYVEVEKPIQVEIIKEIEVPVEVIKEVEVVKEVEKIIQKEVEVTIPEYIYIEKDWIEFKDPIHITGKLNNYFMSTYLVAIHINDKGQLEGKFALGSPDSKYCYLDYYGIPEYELRENEHRTFTKMSWIYTENCEEICFKYENNYWGINQDLDYANGHFKAWDIEAMGEIYWKWSKYSYKKNKDILIFD